LTNSSHLSRARAFAVRLLPESFRPPLRRIARPSLGGVRFGDLGRTEPISRSFGFDRGTPIDRIYIDRFLTAHASRIRGRTLEVVNDTYTARFGGSQTTRRDIIDFRSENKRATIVGDITRLGSEWDDTFDAIVLTQMLHMIYDLQGAVSALYRLLKSGGACLVTVPGLTPIDHYNNDYDIWYWALTEVSARRLFSDVFGAASTHVDVYGNVSSAVCTIHGLAAEELTPSMIDPQDPHYPVTIGICAVKG
jgi:Methyltransferase domain